MQYNRRNYLPYQPTGPAGTRSGSQSVDPRRLRTRMAYVQLAGKGISDERVLAAMAQVPRHLFVPDALAHRAYDDVPLPIGYGQTISQPYTVARMSELLETQPGMRVLEIGAGSGYQAAILAAMGCIVYSVERLRELYIAAVNRVRELHMRSIYIKLGDGTMGLPQAAPFQRIIVSAGGPEIPPPLLDQLGDDGVMVIPVGPRPREQRLVRLRKSGSRIFREDMGSAVFVDLVGNHGFSGSSSGSRNFRPVARPGKIAGQS